MKRGILIITILGVLFIWTGISNATDGELHCTVRNVRDVVNASIQISNYNDGKAIIREIDVYDINTGEPICKPGPWDYLRDDILPNAGTWFSVNRMIDNSWCPGIENAYWSLIKIIWYTDGRNPLYGRITEVSRDKKERLRRSTFMCEIVEYPE